MSILDFANVHGRCSRPNRDHPSSVCRKSLELPKECVCVYFGSRWALAPTLSLVAPPEHIEAMQSPVAVCVALMLLAGCTQALEVQKLPKDMNVHKCQVMCQRFGMKALGPKFAAIRNPTECCSKCVEVYPAATLLQKSQPKPAPEPAAAPTPKTKSAAPEPVKR